MTLDQRRDLIICIGQLTCGLVGLFISGGTSGHSASVRMKTFARLVATFYNDDWKGNMDILTAGIYGGDGLRLTQPLLYVIARVSVSSRTIAAAGNRKHSILDCVRYI